MRGGATSATSRAAASTGCDRSQLAIDLFIGSIRHYLGAYLVELDGADAIVFTGGIGENSARIRPGVCRDLGWFGIELDPALNESGPVERRVSTAGSRVQVWTVPTNEEIVVARQSKEVLERRRAGLTKSDENQPGMRVSARCSWPG